MDEYVFNENVPCEIHKGRPLVSVRRYRKILFTSGFGCNEYRQGHIGGNLTKEDGYLACQNVALRLLNCVRENLGNLDRVEKVLFAFGLVNCSDDFIDLEGVFSGFSDTLFEAFGERGICPHTVGGTRNLPVGNTAAEIEMVVLIRD